MNYLIKIYKNNRKGRDLFTTSVSIKVKFEIDKKEIGRFDYDLYGTLKDTGEVDITGNKLVLIVTLEFIVYWNKPNLGRLSKRLNENSLQKLIDKCVKEGSWSIKRPKHVNSNAISSIECELPESTITLDYLFEVIEEVHNTNSVNRIIRSDYVIMDQIKYLFKNNYTIL